MSTVSTDDVVDFSYIISGGSSMHIPYLLAKLNKSVQSSSGEQLKLQYKQYIFGSEMLRRQSMN